MIIEVDEYKKKIPGYDPKSSELFHRESAKLADKDFLAALKSQKYSKIIFMAGGAASGKTEFTLSYLTAQDVLVYDGTLKNIEGFKIKLHNIRKYCKNNPSIKVVLIVPEDASKAFAVFLQRERKMEHKTFFDTHIRSKVSVAKILAVMETDVEIYMSKIKSDSEKLKFDKLEFTRNEMATNLVKEARDLDIKATEMGLALDINFDIIEP